jgi:hypothetical protein
MSRNYQTLAHEWFHEVWNQRRAESIERLLDTNAIMHGIMDENGNELRGVQAFKAFQGTMYAGMSTSGSCDIAVVVTLPVGIPWTKPEHNAPSETATTRSMIPRMFQATNRRLVANDE